MTVLRSITRAAGREADRYRHGNDRPLRPYLGAMGVYGAAVAALAGVGAATGRRLPDRVGPWDLAVLGVATHKLSRLISKDTVTAPLRAPFTEYEGPQGEGELSERVRGGIGPRHALGELLTCPFCLAQWVATGFAAGLVFAPRATRLAGSTFAMVAVSDALQNVYAALQRAAEG
ncbi:MAG: hypothetical protein V7637_6614 [Mycobacteriales bacterium]|jgi:hypothetical protein